VWAAVFNKLLLPWSSQDWALEQISAALLAASDVLNSTCGLQFQAAAAVTSTSSIHGGGDKCSGLYREQLGAALLDLESRLQQRLVEPVVSVQTGEGTNCRLKSLANRVRRGLFALEGGGGAHVAKE
jgi:hypothetical protein